MSIVPVLLDRPLATVSGDAADLSLLLLPAPDAPLMREMVRAVRQVTAYPPSVLSSFVPSAAYMSRLSAECPSLRHLLTAENFRDTLGHLEPTDSLLIVGPGCYPLNGLSLRALCTTATADVLAARHLLGFESSPSGIKEVVQQGEEGRVRRIQRYYHPATWPFPKGVVASLVPVACLQTVRDLAITSLEDLRRELAVRGVPSEDVPLEGECVDLAEELGALALVERRTSSLWQFHSQAGGGAHSAMMRGTLGEGARLVGPVVVGLGARVDAGAVVVGPAVIGERAHVGAGAVVAQCLVLPGATIADGASLRHRVVVNRVDRDEPHTLQRHAMASKLTSPAGAHTLIVHSRYLVAKTFFEPVVALLALVALLPALVLCALMVCLDSPGPIFYGDRREGRGGCFFRCWKFRSMRTDANDLQSTLAGQQQMDGPQFKIESDPRVTGVGRWLRRLNLDELPQLWNVVLGEMSFVGPRPSPFRENQICVPWRNGRLSVRPGITGLWQVCRRDRALGDFHQWIQYDLLYVHHMSLLVDAKILLATFTTLGGKRPVSVELILPLKGVDQRSKPSRGWWARWTRARETDRRATDHFSVRRWLREQRLGIAQGKEAEAQGERSSREASESTITPPLTAQLRSPSRS